MPGSGARIIWFHAGAGVQPMNLKCLKVHLANNGLRLGSVDALLEHRRSADLITDQTPETTPVFSGVRIVVVRMNNHPAVGVAA